MPENLSLISTKPLLNPMALIDVREDARKGRPPIQRVMEALEGLAPGEPLVVASPFEPVPLFALMKGHGYSHQTRQIAPSHWETLFTPDSALSKEEPAKAPDAGLRFCEPITEVDGRGLEPPEPLVRILSALEDLQPGCVLRALTERRPLHLLDALAERGFRAESMEDVSAGNWVTLIRPA